jgi:hypothetical protein
MAYPRTKEARRTETTIADTQTTQTSKGQISTKLRHSTSQKIASAKDRGHNLNNCGKETAMSKQTTTSNEYNS